MSRYTFILWLGFSTINLISCGPTVTFDTPQPANTNDLSSFPPRLQGKYISLADSSILVVAANHVVRHYDFSFPMHIRQVDSTMYLSGDTLINKETNEFALVIDRKNDSLFLRYNHTDTIFQFNEDHKLRKLEKYFFMNTRSENAWMVERMIIQKGKLIISSISAEEELQSIQPIAEVLKDSAGNYQLSMGKRQFREFNRNGGFSDGEVFVSVPK